MKHRLIAALLAAAAAGFAHAGENWRFSTFDAGRSTRDTARGQSSFDVYRIGLRRDFRRNLWQGERSRLSGYFEASLNYWDADESVFAAAFSPVLVFYWGPEGARFQPYLEFGIGAALISDTQFAGRDFSTTFQFEDRLGIGIRSEALDLHYRYMHYSNGGIEKPNNGFDAHVVGVAFRF